MEKDATLKQAGKLISIFNGKSSEELQNIMSSGFLADIRDSDISQIDRDDFREFLGLSPFKPSILDFIGTVMIPATIESFIPAEKIVRDTSQEAKVRIRFIGDNFNKWFLGDDGKIESPITEQILRYAQLRENSVDKPIITEIGGKDEAETTLTEMFSLMEKQGHGQQGEFLVNGFANIFYILDKNGVLRAVDCRWRGDGWYVRAHSVEDPDRWSAGDRVFSRNST